MSMKIEYVVCSLDLRGGNHVVFIHKKYTTKIERLGLENWHTFKFPGCEYMNTLFGDM